MTLNPYLPEDNSEWKSKDDWYAKTQPKQKRKLRLLPSRKYIRAKGTMVRVKVAPEPPVRCTVLRMIDGQPMETDYLPQKKLLILSDSGVGYVFNSRSAAKKAIFHTVEFEKISNGHVDFEIVNK